MVEMDGAVGIDVDKRTGLVHLRQGERNTEFHRCQRNSLADQGRLAVENGDICPPISILRARLQFFDNRVDNIVILDLHSVGRHIAPPGVEIGLAHIERIKAGFPRDCVNNAFHRQHALRAAKAAKGRVRDRIGFQPPR